MNRSERYRSRNKLSAKRTSKSRILPFLALLLVLVLLLCSPLVFVKDLAVEVPFSPLLLQEQEGETTDDSSDLKDNPLYENEDGLSKTVVINSSIEKNNGVLSSSGEVVSEGIAGSTVIIDDSGVASSFSNGTGSDVVYESEGTGSGTIFGSAGIASGTIYSENSGGVIINSGGFVDAEYSTTRPLTGQIFKSTGKGALPQLTVVAPSDQDAYIKMKDPETGEVVLSFYVRAEHTVKACVPVGYCDFFYVLGDGEDWLGTSKAFGDNGVYAKADRSLNFTNPLNNYTYRFNVDDGNISPVTISKSAF